MENDFMHQVGEEIGVVKDNPRLLIIVSHSFIEMIVKSLTEHYVPHKKYHNHYQRLSVLNQIKVIDKFQFELFNWFRGLRNRAVHTPIFVLVDQDFKPLIGLVKQETLGVDKFHLFSLTLIAELWNKHLDVLGPIYLSKYCTAEA